MNASLIRTLCTPAKAGVVTAKRQYRHRSCLRRSTLFLLLMLLAPLPSHAQADDPALLRAYAAGYKAQFICSGLWNGGKSLANIEADELTGIYPKIADIVPTLKAEIDEANKQVSVAFDPAMPPRVARWQPLKGCAGYPIGYDQPAEPPMAARIAMLDDQKWPMGDKDALSLGQKGTTDLPNSAVNGTFGGKTSAVVVVHHGKIVGEAYKVGHDMHTSQRTWSVAKSIAGTYIGFLRQLTDLPLDRPLGKSQKTDDPRGDINIDNLLRMASGLHSNSAGNRTDNVYMGGGTIEEFAPLWPLLHKPGTHFRYSNNDILLAVLTAQEAQRSVGGDVHPNMLFRKLGMTRTLAETDWKGNYVLSSQVWTTARDMARLGMLYLNNGEWNDEQLLPKNWREYVSAPSGPQPKRQFGYGATFWLINKSEGIPKDTFAGLGNRGQFLIIIPSMDMVIVRRGYDSAGNRFDIEKFTREIVAAARIHPKR